MWKHAQSGKSQQKYSISTHLGQKIHEEMQDVVIIAPNITPLGLRLAGF